MVLRNGFGTRLRTLREQRALTRSQLARKARLSQGYIARLETGTKANPSLYLLARLARALESGVGELVE